MLSKLIAGLLAGATAVSAQCVIPNGTLSDTINGPMRIQVQNASYPEIHNKFMNLRPAGGGDQHLFVGPVGDPTFDLSIISGSIERGIIHAVINGEYSEVDETTKMFMTERGDPRAIFNPTYGCNPDTNDYQVELEFMGRESSPAGGWICVRPAFDGAHEFRYYPPDNSKIDPDKLCIRVKLVALPGEPGDGETTEPTPTPEPGPPPEIFADMTESGFAFLGCAPEEGQVDDEIPERTLSAALLADDAMTNEACVEFCRDEGYRYAGTEFGRECWCADSYPETREPGTTLDSLAGCSVLCMGSASQYCGGAGWLSLYEACSEDSPCENAEFT